MSSDLESKISTLLKQGAEQEKLDYKRTFDIDDTRDIVEITKDIAAMLSSGGGTLLVGADDKGTPVADLSDDLAAKIDEAKLRNKIKKYISEPFTVAVSFARIDGFNHALIECAEYENGLVVFKADGQYPHNGKTKEIFRKGDVFVRHGSASERWEQHDITRIIEARISKRKLEWLKDAELILTRIKGGDNSEQKKHLKEQLSLLKQKIASGTASISDITLVVDTLCISAINAAQEEDTQLFKLTIDSFVKCYAFGFDSRGNWRLDASFQPEDLWREILVRLPLIGGVCVENGQYKLAKYVVLQKVPGDDGRHYPNWYRHALTMASRANRLPKGGNGEKRSFLQATTALLREDDRYKGILGWDDDEGRTFIVRFDYFAALVALDDIQTFDTSAFYTSFAFYEKNRIQQMLVDLLLNEDRRKEIFKSKAENLAYIIQQIDILAEKESDWFWDKGEWATGLNDFMAKAQAFDGNNT